MKSRYATIKQDDRIMAHYLDGKTPKEIVFILEAEGIFVSLWVVYRSVKRYALRQSTGLSVNGGANA